MLGKERSEGDLIGRYVGSYSRRKYKILPLEDLIFGIVIRKIMKCERY